VRLADKVDSSNFSRLGIDINSSQMMMLRAVLAATRGPSKSATYKEITEHLQKLEKKKYTKAYIYRQLSDLKDEGYLVIDSVQTPRKYVISESGIVKSLEKKRKESLSRQLARKQEVATKLNLLKTTSLENVAFILYNLLLGLEPAEESIIIEGIENVRSTIIREFGEAAKPGDVIRIIAPVSILDKGLEKAGMAEMSLMARAFDGVKIIGLMIPTKGKESETHELISNYIQNVKDSFIRLASTGNSSLRIAKENILTYRMVSLNSDKMLLYLTHAADSDMAALILRKDNPGLIDDAVTTFNRIYEVANDAKVL
jgi:DNA-binding PadR family transcriptional regulator